MNVFMTPKSSQLTWYYTNNALIMVRTVHTDKRYLQLMGTIYETADQTVPERGRYL